MSDAPTPPAAPAAPALVTFDRLYYAGTVPVDPATVLTLRATDHDIVRISFRDGTYVRVVGSLAAVQAKLGIDKIPLDSLTTL
jgi:hypothetical protein